MRYHQSLFGATGLWRNWLAHWTVDPGVAGSSPCEATIEMKLGDKPSFLFSYAWQLVLCEFDLI